MNEGQKIISEKLIDELKKIILKEMLEEMKNKIFEDSKNKILEDLKKISKGIFEEMNEKFDEALDEIRDKLIEKLKKFHIEEIYKFIEEKNEKIKTLNKEMNKKMEEEHEATNSALLLKERQSYDEIQEARKELIRGLRDLSCDDQSTIGVKMMGELDDKHIMEVCKQRLVGAEIKLAHAILCWKWQRTLMDPTWHPFKRVGSGERMKEVVDEEDEKLKNLRQEWGEDVKNAVKTALEELNEFNPSGRFTLPVLWNFEQGRKATLKEGIAHMTKEVKILKHQLT